MQEWNDARRINNNVYIGIGKGLLSLKLFNFYAADGTIHIGAADEQKMVDISAAGCSWGWPEIFAEPERLLAQMKNILRHGKPLASNAQRFAPAALNPEKILCVGLNYRAHCAEVPFGAPEYPALFSKFNNALNGHGGEVHLPEGAGELDYEAELVVVMGRRAKNVTEAEAVGAIFGYTAGNDFTARDLQRRTSQWLLGKTPDGFAPVGPYVVPAEDIDVSDLRVETFVNGERRQAASTKDMIFSPAAIVSYISQYMTLAPGDVIFTGTPQGVILGMPEKERCWLVPGDEVVVKIEGVGELRNIIV